VNIEEMTLKVLFQGIKKKMKIRFFGFNEKKTTTTTTTTTTTVDVVVKVSK